MTPTFFPAPAEPPPLGESVHVWRARLDPSAEVLEAWLVDLDPAERSRAERRANAVLRTAALASAAALRRVLARYTGNAPGELVFEREAGGKPRLAGRASPRFNLAHGGDLALIAVHARLEVGIDVEPLVPARVDADLVARVLAPAERAPWGALEPTRRAAAFFDLWAHKEAALKAVGAGLALDPRELVVLLEGGALAPRCETPRGAVHLSPLAVRPGHAAALGVLGTFDSVRAFDLEAAHGP